MSPSPVNVIIVEFVKNLVARIHASYIANLKRNKECNKVGLQVKVKKLFVFRSKPIDSSATKAAHGEFFCILIFQWPGSALKIWGKFTQTHQWTVQKKYFSEFLFNQIS